MVDVAQPCMNGQCLCGAVQYEVSGSLGEVRYCYCKHCRRARLSPIPQPCGHGFMAHFRSTPMASICWGSDPNSALISLTIGLGIAV